jgi:capsular polysaccharide transport system permease protein
MTTKPKAKKFRIRRGGGAEAGAPPVQPEPQMAAASASAAAGGARGGQTTIRRSPAGVAAQALQRAQAAGQAAGQAARKLNPMEELAQDEVEDGFSGERFPTAARSGNVDSAAEVSAEAAIAAIRKEGLTGRQLRMARRVAQKHGLPATSDFDAVRLLRAQGIDPFQRSTMLELVSAEGQEVAKQEKQVQLPQTIEKAQMPAPEVLNAADRARSVMDIQNDIIKRRRKKMSMLAARLAFFVMLPTLIAGYYYYNIATPMYATTSKFVIQQADGGGGAGGLGGMFSGSGLATSQDSITVQEYLTSRDAMLRLDRDVGFKSHFQNPEIDAIQRLAMDASNEDAYKLFSKNVKIGYDPTEGIIKMEVIAASPEVSAQYSEALISYAEERVDALTQRKRDDQMRGARESFEEADVKMLEAQAEVERLQTQLAVFDSTGEATSLMQQISTYEVQLLDKQLQLQQLLDNPRPNQARVDGVRGDISRLEEVIVQLRGKLTENDGGDASIAEKSGKLTVARTNMETRVLLMQQALQQLETARIEANKQTRYLSLGVHPVPPDEPTYPRSFENTILAFLIFAGIYLMISLTASILREQVSG